MPNILYRSFDTDLTSDRVAESRKVLMDSLSEQISNITIKMMNDNVKEIINACERAVVNALQLVTAATSAVGGSNRLGHLRQMTSMSASEFTIDPEHVLRDINDLALAIVAEMSQAINGLANDNPVMTIMALTESALRIEQVEEARRVERETPIGISASATGYGVRAKVVRCLPVNLERIKEVCEGSRLTDIRLNNDGSFLIASLHGDEGMRNISLTPVESIVSIMGDIRIVNDETLRDEYTL